MLVPCAMDQNDTPFDRYVCCIMDGSEVAVGDKYFYFTEDAYNVYESLLECVGLENVVLVLNQPGEYLAQSIAQSISDKLEYGVLPIPEDRKWDIRDGCFPAVLFPEKGA